MLDVTATSENEVQEVQRERYAHVIESLLWDIDWCVVRLQGERDTDIRRRMVAWIGENADEVIWLTGRNQGFAEPLCTWEA